VLPSKITSLRSEVDQFFIKRKINPVCVFESNIISSVIRAASDGMGATILPTVYVSRELKSGKLKQLNSKPLWKHRISLLSTRGELDEGRKELALKLIEQLEAMLE
jgi:DNA-binding transcriptional LysR family regulator